MAERTTHYDLNTIGAGDRLSDDDYKVLRADRHFIDRLLKIGAEAHRHTGTASLVAPPGTGPSVVLGTGGSIPAGVRADYVYTLIDSQGFESGPSPVAFITTPPPVASPAAPTLSYATTGGSLLAGSYYYVLSAYTGTSNSETPALNAALISVPTGTATNVVTLTPPALPAGADGFNVYRRKPGGSRFLYLRSIVGSVAITDNGSIAEDCDRTEPAVNTTASSNKVTVTIPALPAGTVSWRLYRTYLAGVWSSSLLATVSTAGTLSFVDTGQPTVAGSPPGSSQAISAPSRIQLTNGAEVQGRAPLGAISAFPDSVEFEFGGTVQVHQGTGTWVNPYPRATIKGIRAVLGRGSYPSVTPVVVDVNLSAAGADPPVYASVFQQGADRARVELNKQIGVTVPATGASELVLGDALTVDIDQAGGGATPTDADLTVIVYLWAYGFDLVSHIWAT